MREVYKRFAAKEVGRQVLYQQGCYSKQKIWYEGWIPGIRGKFTFGWQGEKQTVICVDIITPLVIFEVIKKRLL